LDHLVNDRAFASGAQTFDDDKNRDAQLPAFSLQIREFLPVRLDFLPQGFIGLGSHCCCLIIHRLPILKILTYPHDGEKIAWQAELARAKKSPAGKYQRGL
jgi:hypothetical protein